mgnify:CR=1 FL=1
MPDKTAKKLIPNEKLLITNKEAMELLGFKSRTLLNWYIKTKALPYVKIGHFIRFNPDAIKKWKEDLIEKTAA